MQLIKTDSFKDLFWWLNTGSGVDSSSPTIVNRLGSLDFEHSFTMLYLDLREF